ELGGCGGVLRNDKDSIIASFSYPLQALNLGCIGMFVMEIGEVRFTFAYREINCLADAMAKAGIDRHCLFFACW
ncbi:hypothetical protein Goshw_002857, partial [Gossypium schwendimanii]|nr:hypothetical protein [Gossypium schwendimanii]